MAIGMTSAETASVSLETTGRVSQPHFLGGAQDLEDGCSAELLNGPGNAAGPEKKL